MALMSDNFVIGHDTGVEHEVGYMASRSGIIWRCNNSTQVMEGKTWALSTELEL